MKIAIGSDHAGVALKKAIIDGFADIEFDDVGTYTEESTDYPDHIAKAARSVADGRCGLGIGICGTGIGASITANKVRGIRAALCTTVYMAEMSRRHNNANMLILGARITELSDALNIVRVWLDTPFEGGRHQARLDKISRLEEERGL